MQHVLAQTALWISTQRCLDLISNILWHQIWNELYMATKETLYLWITKNKERKSFAVSPALIWTNGRHPGEQQTGSPIAASPVLFPQTPLSPHTFLSSLLPGLPFCLEDLSSHLGTLGSSLPSCSWPMSFSFPWFGWWPLWACSRLLGCHSARL